MRKLAIVYLLLYLLDLVISVVASLVPHLEGVSNALSSVLMPAAIVVLVLVRLNKLRPRLFFVLAAGYYLLMAGVGLVLSIALLSKLGLPETSRQISEHSMIQVLSREFSWYVYFHWGLLTIWALLGLYGAQIVLVRGEITQPSAPANGGPPPLPVPPSLTCH
jgi:hypothetical protein